jgi:hypothetical protein
MKVFLFVAVVCSLLLGFLGQALAASPKAKSLRQSQKMTHRKTAHSVRLAKKPKLRVIAARYKKPAFRFVDTEAVTQVTSSVGHRMDDATFERSAN